MIKQERNSSGLPSMKPYLDYLLEKGATKHVTVRWGQSYRKVIFIEGKKYQYKGGHDINKNLKNKSAALYISMSSKPSKQNTTTGNLNVDLKFDDDADEDKPRTWINKEGFDEFESEYRESQDDSSLANTSSVEFEIHVKMVKLKARKRRQRRF